MATTTSANAASNSADRAGNSEQFFETTLLGWNQSGRGNQLAVECDTLADELTRTFEELYCLRQIAGEVSACDVSQSLPSAAEQFLPGLREILSAKTAVLFSESVSRMSPCLHGRTTSEPPVIVQSGSPPVTLKAVRNLVQQLCRLSSNDAVVFNSGSTLDGVELETTAKNLVAVPLVHQQSRYGWLMTIDRQPESSSGDFGSREVNLLTTAASMLAGHARNVELFRAEERLRTGVIEAITGALDARDPYTCGHSRRVAQLAVQIAKKLGVAAEPRKQLYITGLLHDVGKIGVPDAILLKPDKLTDEEFEVIKRHPSIGHQILSPLEPLRYVLPGVLYHHERIDGRGYPHGLSGDKIPLDARILAVADSFDAMTSNRAYRSGMPPEQAIGILADDEGRQSDPEIVLTLSSIAFLPRTT